MTRRRSQQTVRKRMKRAVKANVETVFEEDAVVDVDVDVDGPQDAAAEYTIRKVVIAVLGLANKLD